MNKKPNLSRFLNKLKVKMLIYQGLWGGMTPTGRA
jgi:hypothetical protein|nr:MAG TPA: Transcriptional regulator [Caudoviricetes sp.]